MIEETKEQLVARIERIREENKRLLESLFELEKEYDRLSKRYDKLVGGHSERPVQ